ncbi:YbeD family protein [Sulfuricurvum sp.]|uniref:HP0495 family protein n=1 Tax=Sulfuricurvum sp. TaxID=2025608 RepID=UPI003BB785CF
MVIINETTQKVELTYPCTWCYKVVAYERAGIEIAAIEIFSERQYSLNPSNVSKGGKYISMNLELLVHNEDERTYFYETLKAHPHIKMVL